MKEKVRKKLILLRKKISTDEVLNKSNIIKNKLFELEEFKKASTVLFYVSYDNEVFTHDMIKESMKMDKEIIVPKSDEENRRLILSKLDKWEDLEKGLYNILEPKKEKIKEISIEKIDLIIVPGVGFDEQGNRTGHGKGYYDNLLRNCKNALSIGLAFEFQIIKNIPTNNFDIPVDVIITDKRIIKCRKIS